MDSKNTIKNDNYAICDFCKQEPGKVIDIDANLTIVICAKCEMQMKQENDKYNVKCNICGEECTNCSN